MFIYFTMDSFVVFGLLATVALVNSDTTTNVVVCPFSDPLAHGVSCLQDGFSSVQYNSMEPDPGSRPPPSTQQSPRKRGAPVATVSVERGPDVPPPSTLDLSPEFVEYFCSESGSRMVDCAMEVYTKCTDHASMFYFSFNPVQADRARKLCDRIDPDYAEVARCLNQTARTEAFLDCATAAYETYSQPRPHETYIDARCRATAAAYNCYTTLGERFCGQTTIDFSVALMRVMEERHCTPIVDNVYIAPVSAGARSKSTLYLTISSSLSTVMLFILSVL